MKFIYGWRSKVSPEYWHEHQNTDPRKVIIESENDFLDARLGKEYTRNEAWDLYYLIEDDDS